MATEIECHDESTFTVTFNYDDSILTTVTSSAYEVETWLETIYRIHRRRLNHLVVGLDIEWRPTFNRNQYNRVAVLQLCVGRRCLIFQIIHADYIPQDLDDFLGDERFTFVGVGIDGDAERLYNDYNLQVENTEDLRKLAVDEMGRPDLRNTGLQNLVRLVMGVDIDKPRAVRIGRWDAECLSYQQIIYACVDAFTSFEVGRRLIAGHF